jgi:hypothetical protein
MRASYSNGRRRSLEQLESGGDWVEAYVLV